MSKRILVLVAFVATVLSVQFSGCRSKETAGNSKVLGKPLAKVDGLTLYEKDLEIYAQGMHWTPQQKKDFIEQWTKIALLYLAAKDEGYDKDPLVRRKLELNNQLTLVQDYEAHKMASVMVSPQEVDSLYNQHKDLFDRNAKFLIVYSPDTNKLKEIDRKLRGKTGSRLFMAVEEVKSDSTVTAFETQSPVNLGIFYLTYNDIPKELRDKVAKLKPGQGVWGPYESDAYIYLFIISENRVAADPQQVKGFIQQYLADSKRKAIEDSLIEKMKKKYTVEIFSDSTDTNAQANTK